VPLRGELTLLRMQAPERSDDVEPSAAAIGVEQPGRSPMTLAGGDLLFLSHGYFRRLRPQRACAELETVAELALR
jgi:hypothetical protein